MRRLPFLILAFAPFACAQNFTQRGFLESGVLVYPETAPGDSGRAVGEALFRYEAFYKLTNLRFAGGIVPDLLDVMTEEEVWVAKERNRTPRTRAQLSVFIDRSLLDEAKR